MRPHFLSCGRTAPQAKTVLRPSSLPASLGVLTAAVVPVSSCAHCSPLGEVTAASLERKESASPPDAGAHPGAFSLFSKAFAKKESSLPN